MTSNFEKELDRTFVGTGNGMKHGPLQANIFRQTGAILKKEPRNLPVASITSQGQRRIAMTGCDQLV